MRYHICTSSITGKEYSLEQCIEILNPKQALFYIDRGCTIQDIYPSINYQSGKENLIFIFERSESADLYPLWLEQRGSKLKCKHPEENTDENLARIINISQVIFYLKNKAKLMKCAPVLDYRSHDAVLAFYFSKSETEKIEKQWKQSRKH